MKIKFLLARYSNTLRLKIKFLALLFCVVVWLKKLKAILTTKLIMSYSHRFDSTLWRRVGIDIPVSISKHIAFLFRLLFSKFFQQFSLAYCYRSGKHPKDRTVTNCKPNAISNWASFQMFNKTLTKEQFSQNHITEILELKVWKNISFVCA